MKNNKILVVNDNWDLGSSYSRPFRMFGEAVGDPGVLYRDPDSVRLVVFTGGADVSPHLYGEKMAPRTSSYAQRDMEEVKIFEMAKKLGKPMFGICRGSQFLCVMAGGKLCQHVTGHSGMHDMETNDGRIINVNSTHHQMQLPPPGAKVLAWASPKRSTCYEVNKHPEFEYECVYYPNIKAIGTQYHPEAMNEQTEGYQYCVELATWLLAQ